ncbi:MAG: glycosyltransferase family 4 protein [Lachnospiraceae bacterium]|nr:glycosyltransferase family 4 protein [Lachnospiraceae bacterium]
MQVPFVLLTSSIIKRGIFWLGQRFHNGNIRNAISEYTHPLWSRYRKKQLDLMIISGPHPVEKIKTAKIITPIHDLMQRYIDFPEVGGGCIGEERDESYINICKKSDGVLVDSLLGKRQMLECYGHLIDDLASKVHVLPYIAPDYIYGKELMVETFDKYILYPAQFWKHKNHIRLVQAAAQLKDKGIIVNLVLTGTEKNNKKDVEDLIQELALQAQIQILDYVTNEQLVYLYKHTRALAMPTFAGPTNIPPLEALAIGCPMMLSNNFAMPEQAGDAALYFNPESVDEIADCMEKLWTDDELCARLISNGAIQRNKWGIEQFHEKLKEIMNAVIVE